MVSVGFWHGGVQKGVLLICESAGKQWEEEAEYVC